MEASPAPMTILHASRVQKLLAKPQPTDDTMKIAMPHPVTTPQTNHMPLEQLIMHAGICMVLYSVLCFFSYIIRYSAELSNHQRASWQGGATTAAPTGYMHATSLSGPASVCLCVCLECFQQGSSGSVKSMLIVMLAKPLCVKCLLGSLPMSRKAL